MFSKTSLNIDSNDNQREASQIFNQRANLIKKINDLKYQLNLLNDQQIEMTSVKDTSDKKIVKQSSIKNQEQDSLLFNEQTTIEESFLVSFLSNSVSRVEQQFGQEKVGEEELTVSQRKTLIVIALIVVSGIVLVSIAFEKMQEYAEEHIIEVLKPILKSIFGELTILGFIGTQSQSGTKVKGDTQVLTLQLYNRGFTPDQISIERDIQLGTVYNHLTELYARGQKIDWKKLISKKELDLTIQQLERSGEPFRLKELHEALEGKISYDRIKFAIAYYHKVVV